MKKLLLTTAIVMMSTTSAHAFSEQATQCSIEVSKTLKDELKLHSESNFYQGDFQSIAKSTTTESMYTGHGASLMMSIRMFRY